MVGKRLKAKACRQLNVRITGHSGPNVRRMGYIGYRHFANAILAKRAFGNTANERFELPMASFFLKMKIVLAATIHFGVIFADH